MSAGSRRRSHSTEKLGVTCSSSAAKARTCVGQSEVERPGAGAEALPQPRLTEHPPQGGGERVDVARRHQEARGRRHGVGGGAAGAGDHRQAARQRLGERHAVALIARRQHEHVCAMVRGGDGSGVELPGKDHAIVQSVARDRRAHAAGRFGMVEAAGASQRPVEIGAPRQLRDQRQMVLARRQCRDAQQVVARSGRRRHRVGARHNDAQAVGGDAVIALEGLGGVAAGGNDDASGSGERRALGVGQPCRRRRVPAGLQRRRVVHQRHAAVTVARGR